MADKVLVIEDDVEINELLGEYLALENITYVSAVDGNSGLVKASAEQPRGIILDLMLPDVDGYVVCRTLASHRSTSCIPVVILTCMNQTCDREKAIASGCIRFVNKPFLPDDLLNTLKEAFAWRDGLATRPARGNIVMTASQPEPAYRALRDMTADLFTYSPLSEQTITGMWDGLLSLVDWINRWSHENKKPTTLTVSYRLLAKGDLVPAGGKADAIEWTFTESAPALLAQTLLKPAPAKPDAKGTAPDAASPWQLLFSKLGVSRFDKDSKAQKVTIVRHFTELPGLPVPIVSIDGTRIPGRTLQEALSSKTQ